MAHDDWFRNHTWSPQVSEAFFARLAKSRNAGNRAQYLRIQAVELASTNDDSLVRVALQLLDQHLRDFDDPYERVRAHAQAAACHAQLLEPDEAFLHFRYSLEANRSAPNVDCGVNVEYPWLVATLRRIDHFDAALEVMPSEAPAFPISRFKLSAARAIIADARGESADAVRHAREALDAASATESGFRFHQKLGLVEGKHNDVLQWLRKRVVA
jgi:hypothetical protein